MTFTDRYVRMCRANPLPEFGEHNFNNADWIEIQSVEKGFDPIVTFITCLVEFQPRPDRIITWLPLDCDLWALIPRNADMTCGLHRFEPDKGWGINQWHIGHGEPMGYFGAPDRLEALLSFVMLLKGYRWGEEKQEWGKEGV